MRQSQQTSELSRRHPALVFTVIFVAIFLLHWPLLRLPYYWDEAGYYTAAARDLLAGSLIPHTTVSNAHPPLVMAWVALWWKCLGFSTVVTRSAMLVVAAFSLLGFFRLAERAANAEVAIAATVCTALYPVFFAQSSLCQVDLAAAGLTFWALAAYLERRWVAVGVWFALAVLAKETAALVPVALAGWEIVLPVITRFGGGRLPWLSRCARPDSRGRLSLHSLVALIFPTIPLALWYAYHYSRTGYVFGNPEFFRYNVSATMDPLRFLLALLLRIWQAFGYMHLWLLTGGMLLAMLLAPVRDGDTERPRIAIPTQLIFLVVVAAYVVAMALIGGAVLARYMLTAVPLVILVGVSTLWRRLRDWQMAVAAIGLAFILAWFWNPPYGFAPEDNLAYRDFIVLHQDSARFVEAHYPKARVLTAWPSSNELAQPWLGYVDHPVKVVQIEDFSADEVMSAAEMRHEYDVALVFSTKYEPRRPMLERWAAWTEIKRKYFGYHRDLPPGAVAQILGGKIVFSEETKGQWAAVIEVEKGEFVDARLSSGYNRVQ